MIAERHIKQDFQHLFWEAAWWTAVLAAAALLTLAWLISPVR